MNRICSLSFCQWDMIQLQHWGTVDASNYGHHTIRNMIAVVDEVDDEDDEDEDKDDDWD